MTTHANAEAIRYTADAVLLTIDGRVLLIKRRWDPCAGRWAFPGGHVDAGETSRDAAVRELEEETGIRIAAGEPWRQVGVFDDPDRDPRGRYVTVAYAIALPEAIAPTPGDDAAEARWWPVSNLPPLAFDHIAILKRVCSIEPYAEEARITTL